MQRKYGNDQNKRQWKRIFVLAPLSRGYRYYIPQRDAKEYAGASKLPRLRTAELEAAVLGQLLTMMCQPVMISEIVTQASYVVTAILDDTLPDHITLLELAADPPWVWGNQIEQIGL